MSTNPAKYASQAFISVPPSKWRCLKRQCSFMGNTCVATRAPCSTLNQLNRRPRVVRTRTNASAKMEDAEGDCLDQSNSEMHVYKKRGQRRDCSQDDMLPFDVSITSPPPEHLGRFRLDPKTHCGDIVEHDGRHFVVKSVRMRYKYLQGKYRMIGKAIEVKSLARKSIEAYLEKSFRES